MAFIISTNLATSVTQTNLDKASVTLNSAIQKMATGYKVNSDNNSAYSINDNWETTLGSLDIAADNAVYGADLLAVLQDSYSAINNNLERIRDLAVQAEDKEIEEKGIEDIKAEIADCLGKIDEVSENCNFGDKNLMNGSIDADIDLQIGLASNSQQIVLDKDLFKKNGFDELFEGEQINNLVEKFTQPVPEEVSEEENDKFFALDNAINKTQNQMRRIEDVQNEINSLIESIEVQSENITSSLSQINDLESSKFIQAEIFQKPKETLFATANQDHNSVINLL